jgi:hypothetical protein
MKRIILAGLLMLGALSIDAMARDIRTERVTFEKGATSATIASNINGYESVDYVLRARKGQYMKASVATKHGATYFSRTYLS